MFGLTSTQTIYFSAVAGSQYYDFLYSFKLHQLPDLFCIAKTVDSHFLPDVYRRSVMADTYGE